MRKRYLPFGYQIKHGEIAIALKESNAVRFIFEEYLAGKSLKGIADIMSANAWDISTANLPSLTAESSAIGKEQTASPKSSRSRLKSFG